eukprot:TRINITY_DN2990_c0_g1_i4.p1 TRINITY_DN2990_c0_g1~~TRINITY_DN2990_c0_g1_i4.p1  ORF type:complete len:212 (+),score=8.41 TRINITY_DN2990_c0_g1_i4:304-939(+)
MCANPSSCPYGQHCFFAHDRKEAYCQSCLEHGHTLADHGDNYCVSCRKDGHELANCKNKVSRWCESIIKNTTCVHGSSCRFAHHRDTLVCSFCMVKGHGLDECANPAVHCGACNKKGHSQYNQAVCRGRVRMVKVSMELADFWIPLHPANSLLSYPKEYHTSIVVGPPLPAPPSPSSSSSSSSSASANAWSKPKPKSKRTKAMYSDLNEED